MSEVIVKKVTFGDNSSQYTAADRSFRNKVINGDMTIDQERAGAAYLHTTGTAAYTLDQWFASVTQTSKLTFQQVSDAPYGFKYSEKVLVTSAYTPGASDAGLLGQRIEGLNIIDLAWGTSQAKDITISFWIKGSVSGNYAIGLRGSDRSYAFTVPVTASWTKVSQTVPGCTDGTWPTDINNGLTLSIVLGAGTSNNVSSANTWISGNYYNIAGSVQMSQTAGATLNITGVQLEKAGAASEFEYISYDEQLRRCKRYWNCTQPALPKGSSVGCTGGVGVATNAIMTSLSFIPMRIVPTLTIWYNGTQNSIRVASNGNAIGAGLYSAGLSNSNLSFVAFSGTPISVGTGYDFDLIFDARL